MIDNESLVWHAIYKNGTMLSQYAGEQENSSEAIDKTQLSEFYLTNKSGNLAYLICKFKAGQKMLYRVRNMIHPHDDNQYRVHIIGKEENGVMTGIFVHENPFKIIIGDFTANDHDNPWHYQIVRLPHDEIEVE